MNNHINLLLQQAINNLENGNISQTKILLKNILGIQPKNFNALNLMGITLGIENKHEEAITFFSKSVKIDPQNYYANFNLAKALSENGDNLVSLKYHEAATRISPQQHEAWFSYAKSLLS